MSGGIQILRALMIYGLGLPMAVVLGYTIANPVTYTDLAFVGGIIALLALPTLLRKFQPLLLLSWNSTVAFAILPGKPSLCLLLIGVGLMMALFNYALHRNVQWIQPGTKAVGLGFLAFGLVVFLTVLARGGFHFSMLGGQTAGAKAASYYLASVAGFFILSQLPIPKEKAQLYVGLFFLGSCTYVVSYIIDAIPSLFWLHAIIPSVDDKHLMEGSYDDRWGTGFAVGSTYFATWMLCRYGLTGIVTIRNPLRPMLFITVIIAGFLPGFRLQFLVILLLLALQSWLERAWKSKPFLIFATCSFVGFLMMASMPQLLPNFLQRTLSILPINVDSRIRASSEGTIQWRYDMIMYGAQELPNYIWFGRGLNVNYSDATLILDKKLLRGPEAMFHLNSITGDYLNGFLTITIAFGAWGIMAVFWMFGAGGRLMYRYYREGDVELKNINTSLFAYFITISAYALLQGMPSNDIPRLTGVLALSIALNRKRSATPEPDKMEHLTSLVKLPPSSGYGGSSRP